MATGVCSRCNVLLLTIDTLRSDRVGAFGSARGLTPTLDRLANAGIRFTRAYASAPLTLPSHVSIMTAASPPVHGVRNNSLFRLGPGVPTLAAVLASNGYRTGAFVGAFVLDARFGLNRGFDVYDDKYGERHAGDPTEGAERRAEDVIKPALAWILEARGQGLEAWSPANLQPLVLSLQPLAPSLQPLVPSLRPLPPGSPGSISTIHTSRTARPSRTRRSTSRTTRRSPTPTRWSAICSTHLAAAGQLDRTLIAFTADHGESLGEHGEATHGVFTYDVTMRVPSFLWAGPRLRARAYDGLTRLIDLAPTVLDLLGIAAPPAFEGQSLVPALNRRAGEPPRGVHRSDGREPHAQLGAAHRARHREATSSSICRFRSCTTSRPIPHEQTNLFTRDGERARALEALLRDRLAQFAARGSHADTHRAGRGRAPAAPGARLCRHRCGARAAHVHRRGRSEAAHGRVERI